MKHNQIVRVDGSVAIALRHHMELLWFSIANEPDTDGLDLEEEIYWVYIVGARQVVAITNMEALGDIKGIKLCKSRNSEIVRWYV